MKRLLSIFPLFRALEIENRAHREQKAALEARLQDAKAAQRFSEGELSFWKQKSKDQDAEIRRLNELLLTESHKVADTMSIHAIGKRVYSKAVMPDSAIGAAVVAGPIQGPPITGRAAVRKAEQDIRGKLQEMWANLDVPKTNASNQ